MRIIYCVVLSVFAIMGSARALVAAPIASGENQSGSISAGTSESWTFSVNINQTIHLRVGEVSGGNGFSPRIQLYGPSNTVILSDYDSLDARIVHRATVAGTYTAVVSGYYASDAGSYRLCLLLSPGSFVVPAGDDGGVLTNGQNHSGGLDVGDIDAWTYEAGINETLHFRIGKISGGSAFSPLIYLYDPNGAQVTYDYDTVDSRIIHRATLAGIYTLVVVGYYDGDAGTYLLRFLTTKPGAIIPAGDNGGALTNGQNHPGEIGVGDMDSWTYSAAINETLSFRVGKITGGSGFSPLIYLYDPNGAQVTYDYDTVDSRILHRATLAGNYTLVVAGYYDGDVGSYNLRLFATGSTPIIPTGDEGGPLQNGENHVGTISVGDIDPWRITAGINETLTVRVAETSGGSGFSPLIYLYDPNGAQVTYDYDAIDSRIIHRTTLAGTYTVKVVGYYDGDTGGYRLSYFKTPGEFVVAAGDEGGVLVNGGRQAGSLQVGDVDTWTVQAEVNDALLFRVGEVSGGNGFSPLIYLYDPNGQQVTYDYDAVDARISHRATMTGTYTLTVMGYYDGDTGGYALHHVQTPATPLHIAMGDQGGSVGSAAEITGEITSGDLDPWVVYATVGNTLTFTITEVSGGNSFTPMVSLYDPSGALVRTTWGSTTATITHPVTAAGNHTLVVHGYYDGDAGNYRVGITGASAPAVPMFASQPASQGVSPAASALLSPTINGTGPMRYQWFKDGVAIAGAKSSSYSVSQMDSAASGVYWVEASNELAKTRSGGAVVGLSLSGKLAGSVYEHTGNIAHSNGNTYDQMLLNGSAATYRADPGQIVRASFLDQSDDIVQLEFSGSGSLTVLLDGATGPASPTKYNQPTVQYMRGQARILIVGADENTHLGIYTVGTLTNSNPNLYVGGVSYDGFADLGYIAIQSSTGRFGGVRIGSTELFSDTRVTGIYAPGVRFAGPLNLHNVSAAGTASPFLLTGVIDTGRISITGGDLLQPNGAPIAVGNAQEIAMVAGSNSHGVPAPAQVNRGKLERDGVDVTSQVIRNP